MEQVASIHRAAERKPSRKPICTRSHRYALGPGVCAFYGLCTHSSRHKIWGVWIGMHRSALVGSEVPPIGLLGN